MGKLLELLKGVSLPPEIESQIRIFDLQFEALEMKCNELEQEAETTRMKDDDKTGRSDQFQRSQEVSGYTTQKFTHPDEPTDEEAKILKLLQPPGKKMGEPAIAQRMGINLTTTQYYLNELRKKDYVHHFTTQAVAGIREMTSTYSLSDKGVKFLVEHNLTE